MPEFERPFFSNLPHKTPEEIAVLRRNHAGELKEQPIDLRRQHILDSARERGGASIHADPVRTPSDKKKKFFAAPLPEPGSRRSSLIKSDRVKLGEGYIERADDTMDWDRRLKREGLIPVQDALVENALAAVNAYLDGLAETGAMAINRNDIARYRSQEEPAFKDRLIGNTDSQDFISAYREFASSVLRQLRLADVPEVVRAFVPLNDFVNFLQNSMPVPRGGTATDESRHVTGNSMP